MHRFFFFHYTFIVGCGLLFCSAGISYVIILCVSRACMRSRTENPILLSYCFCMLKERTKKSNTNSLGPSNDYEEESKYEISNYLYRHSECEKEKCFLWKRIKLENPMKTKNDGIYGNIR